MYIEIRSHMREDLRCENANSPWWFVLCWLYKPYCDVASVFPHVEAG
jgi:hypothetical protein